MQQMKTITKRIISLILATAVMICVMPSFESMAGTSPIPAAAKKFGDHYYYAYHADNLQWSDAERFCEYLGGHLLTITSNEEESFIFNDLLCNDDDWYWIGAFPENGIWKWVTGEDTSYTPCNGWPVAYSNYYCGLRADNKTLDVSDWYTTAYICEWDSYVVNPDILVESITLNKSDEEIITGGRLQLEATVFPDNATDKKVVWSSSNPNVATVDSKGLVTGIKGGVADIYAETQNGSKTAACTVTVKESTIPVNSVRLNKTSVSIAKGKTVTLTPTVSPGRATNKGVTWESSDTSVATVSKKGVVKGVGAGEATITVTTQDGEKTANCKVTVKAPVKVKSKKFNKKTYNVKKGNTVTLKTTFNPKNPSNKTVTYKSSNKKIATVDKNGKVKGIKKGTVTITVTTKDGKKTAKCKVVVK